MMQMADPNGEAASAEFISVYLPTHANDCLAKYVYVAVSCVNSCLIFSSSIVSEKSQMNEILLSCESVVG